MCFFFLHRHFDKAKFASFDAELLHVYSRLRAFLCAGKHYLIKQIVVYSRGSVGEDRSRRSEIPVELQGKMKELLQ